MRMQPTHEKQHTLWKRWMEMREELGASDTLLRELAAEYFTELARLAYPFRALPWGRCGVPSQDQAPASTRLPVAFTLYCITSLTHSVYQPFPKHLEVDTVRHIMQAIHLFKNQANTLHLFEIVFQQTDSVIGKTATNLELRWRYIQTLQLRKIRVLQEHKAGKLLNRVY